MPETHDSQPFVWHRGPFIVSCESLFWHFQRYPNRRVTLRRPPLTELANPRELEQPYRHGHGRIFRFPCTRRAVVLGYWVPADPDDVVLADEEGDRLLAAVEGAHIPGITATEIADWARGRDAVAFLDRLRARWRRFWDRPVYRERADVDDDSLDGWQAETGWSVVPWNPEQDRILDLEDARVQL